MGLVSLRAIEGVQMLCKAKNATGLQTLLHSISNVQQNFVWADHSGKSALVLI